jgi:molybdopterin adenylyltransferase
MNRPASSTVASVPSSSAPTTTALPAAAQESFQRGQPRSHPDELRIGLVSVSDRASAGVYADQGLPGLREWLGRAMASPWVATERLVADEAPRISAALLELVDVAGCDLVLTTGGTGPSRRDVTPEATLAVATREMPGFGEQMRRISLEFVPTAILSRQVGVLREIDGHAALILNLPGQPKAIAETLEGLRAPDGTLKAAGIFAAVPYCIQLIGGPYMETHEAVVRSHRPKTAVRAAK